MSKSQRYQYICMFSHVYIFSLDTTYNMTGRLLKLLASASIFSINRRITIDYWTFVDRIDRFVRVSTSRSCFPLLSLSVFPLRTLFGRSLVIRCNFAPIVLGILGQPRLLDFCESSRPLCQRFNFSFLFLFSGGDRKWSLASVPVLVSGGDPVTTEHRRTWPLAPAPVLVSGGDRKWSLARVRVLVSGGDRKWSLRSLVFVF